MISGAIFSIEEVFQMVCLSPKRFQNTIAFYQLKYNMFL